MRKSTYLDAIVRDIRVIGFSLWKILGNPLISSSYKTGKVRICPLGMSKNRAGIRPDEFRTGAPRRETASTETDETSGVSNQFQWAIERSKSSPWLLSFSFSPLFIFLHKQCNEFPLSLKSVPFSFTISLLLSLNDAPSAIFKWISFGSTGEASSRLVS